MSNEAPAEKPAAVLNAEASVIGGLFIASEMLPAVMAIIDAGDFFADRNARIFRAIVSLIEAGEIVDAVTLPARLHERGDFERVGGTKYLSHIMDAVPTASNIEYHARVVAKHSARRRLRAAAEAIQALASSGDMDADELRAEAERLIAEASPGRAGGGLTPIADLLPDFLRHLEEMTDPHAPEAGVRTGIRSVDDRLGPMNPGQLILVAGRPSMGKAQPLSAQVLTPHGFAPMWSIRPGSVVIGGDGKPCRVRAVFPQGEKQVFRVAFSDGSSTECCDEHLWFTRTVLDRKRGAPGSVKPLSEIRKTLVHGSASPRWNHWIPWVEPVEFAGSALPVHPYALGLYLGDGTSSGCVRLHNPEIDLQERFSEMVAGSDVVRVDTLGSTATVARAVRANVPSGTKLRLDALGLTGRRSEEKFIPAPYLLASVRDRLALLRGLMDTDGFVYSAGGGVEYVTVSPKLAENVRFLALSLGGRVTTHEKEPTYTYRGEKRTGRQAFRMNICFDNGIVPVSSTKHLSAWKDRTSNRMRRIVAVEPVGIKPCQCISVENESGLYVTDDFIVTHNTAFGVGNVAMHAALEQGKRVAIFSVETDPAGMMSRIMAAEGSVNMTRARKRRAFGDDEYPRMAHAAGRLRAAPVFLDHTPGLTVDQMRARLRKAEAQSGAMDLIVVDYLQLMSHPRAKSRYEEVSNIGMGLKRIASEFGAAVLALAQLSRAVEQRPDKRPLMSDLRESGTLEQDADAILLLYRPEYYHGATMTVGRGKEAKEVNVEGKAQIILGKVRDGETGTAVVAFEGEYTRFRDLSTREEFAR